MARQYGSVLPVDLDIEEESHLSRKSGQCPTCQLYQPKYPLHDLITF